MAEHECNGSSDDLVQLTKTAENIVRCFIYRMLEKVINKSSCEENFRLHFSLLPEPVLCEIRAVKEYLRKCESSYSTEKDSWFIHKAVQILEEQGGIAIQKYHHAFLSLINQLQITDEYNFAYTQFVEVAKKLFENDNIAWSHIVSLICFGVEISVYIVEHGKVGLASFLKKICSFIVDFIVKEEILQWIAQHGGWIKMIDFFDDPNCQFRTNHILAAMAISELTNIEVWLQRFFVASLVSGIIVIAWRKWHQP
ncbi:uncharacterized protein LOC100212122 [Hydra vulgaris]|uniref:Bak-like 2 n=1 Tax=Hydra vulgaris TaxID=6087 RepID=A7LM76_HYDVU|nr:uncharacterized protein LOC100212122 [Hydra vulgaris]ABS84169.1 bak-like 2 [Hydra vulgaris]